MALDLWWSEDVARILASTRETMLASQARGPVNEDYQQGFVDALRSVAVAFGVVTPKGPGHSPWPPCTQDVLIDGEFVARPLGRGR